jgi:hypothetical protein
MIAKVPTIAAACYRYSIGWPIRYPRNNLEYTTRFLHMMKEVPSEPLELNPVAAKAMDLLFILHADHEQNASTSTVRLVGSTGANPYVSVAAGVAALWGPAHGGANEAVLKMLAEIGKPENVGAAVAKAKDKESGFRLMGFGHRVYKNFDPRAQLIREMTTGAGRAGRQRSAARSGDAPGRGRAEGRVLRAAQALPERRLLLRHHLQGAGHPGGDVHRDVRHRPYRRLGVALAGAAERSGKQDRPSAPDLHRLGRTATTSVSTSADFESESACRPSAEAATKPRPDRGFVVFRWLVYALLAGDVVLYARFGRATELLDTRAGSYCYCCSSGETGGWNCRRDGARRCTACVRWRRRRGHGVCRLRA